MRLLWRLAWTLLFALTWVTSAAAQGKDDRVSFSAAIGPSVANVGSTVSTFGGVEIKLHDRATLVGEVGTLARAPFREASAIAAPVPAHVDAANARVHAYHLNANLKVRPFEVSRLEPYVTGGLGSFTTDTVIRDVMVGTTRLQDRRRTTDVATNLGAGLTYRFNDWVGIGADYRTFFVHRDESTPRVNRFTAALTLTLK